MYLTLLLCLIYCLQAIFDFAGIFKPGWRTDAGNCAAFAVGAVVLLVGSKEHVYAYACLLVSVAFGLKALVAFRKKRSEGTD